MTDCGIRKDLSTAKISIMGVVKAMKNIEHMPPKVRAIRRAARFAPSSLMAKLKPKSSTENSVCPLPCMKATTPALSKAKERGTISSRE